MKPRATGRGGGGEEEEKEGGARAGAFRNLSCWPFTKTPPTSTRFGLGLGSLNFESSADDYF